MPRTLLLILAGVLIGAGAALWLLDARDATPPRGGVAAAFVRARAYYVNETNADYRRARNELLPVEEQAGDTVAWRLDMALIDLAERNHPVQDQDKLLGDPPAHQRLLESALGHLERARALAPDHEAVAYNLARTYRKLAASAANEEELLAAARALLEPLVAQERPDPAALMQLAELRYDADDFEGALELYTRVVGLGSDYVPATQFRVAELRRPDCMVRLGRTAEGAALRRALEEKYVDPPRPSADALETGRYTAFLDPGDAPATRPDPRGMNWVRVTARTGLAPLGSPRALILPDLDGDCARDVVMNADLGNGRSALRVYRNRRNASFEDLTASAGLPSGFEAACAAAGDLDNDGRTDLVVGGPDGVRLFLGRTDPDESRRWRFAETTLALPAEGAPAAAAAQALAVLVPAPGRTAAEVEAGPVAALEAAVADWEGIASVHAAAADGLASMLVVFAAERGPPADARARLEAVGGAPLVQPLAVREGAPVGPPVPRLGPAGRRPATSLLLWDFDHDGDLDVFAGGEPNRIWRTVVEMLPGDEREVRFEDVTGTLGMAAPPAAHAALLDVEDDQDVDLLVSGPAGSAWFENLRQMRFERRDLPASGDFGFGDLDHDLHEEVRVGRTVLDRRDGAWVEAGERVALLDLDGDGSIDDDPFAGLVPAGAVERALGADLNRDGGRDLLLVTDAGLDVYLSRPDRPAAWIEVVPRGREANVSGIGTRVRLFAGDLRVGTTCRDGLVAFGLGLRTDVDALLLRWTNGVEQGVVRPTPNQCLVVEEREGEVGSCPFLYAWDGERWHFVADVHSGTPLGLPYADGKYLPPRSDESILVDGAQLRPGPDGRVRLDLAEEFRELFYADHVVLRAADHPAGVRPVLNEGFKVMHHPEFRVHGLDDLRPPRSARDHRGRDILDRVATRDLRHAVVFEPLDSRFVGLARPWWIELDFGDLSGAERVLLVMDGWVEFPTASASIAASQSATVDFRTPTVEVIGEDGAWVMADADAGFPAGKVKSVLVDLTGKFPTIDGRIRIASTQRIHWDAFSVSTGPDREVRLATLPLVHAEHRFRGVGRRIEDPEGELPWRYSHDDLLSFVPYDQLPDGMLTRYGDVRALLAEIDSRYPVLAAGDVVELAFDAAGLPEVPAGWTRTWVFTTHGWVKDADMNQAVRESVAPLPFHGMSGYPYPEDQSHPHPDFVEEWFTRPARTLVDPAALGSG